MPPELLQFLQALGPLIELFGKLSVVSLLGLLILAIIKPGKKWLVPTSYYDEANARADKAEARADRWEGMALRTLGVADRAVATIDPAIKATPPKEG